MEKIKLDLVPSGKMPSLHASQFDDGREHGIDLFENGVAYKLDGTETLTINERKGDDCICSLDIENTFTGSNHIVFASTEQMCAVWGNNICELVIAKGEKTIGTLNFILEIEQSPTEGGIESESEIKNLERQIEAITEEVIGDNYYTAEETDDAIETATEGKADKTYVDTELDKKADKRNTYTKSEVDTLIDNLPEPMVFKGTLGVGGTIETLPTASASNEGWMFKCITAGTYAGLTLKVGDTVTCFNPPNTSNYYWDKTGSQDTDTDTWRNIKVNGVEKLGNGISSGAVDFVGSENIEVEFDSNGNKVGIKTKNIYTKTEVDGLLDDKADKVDTYTKEQVDDIVYNILPDDTASGSVATFNTSLALPIKSLEVDVNAVQEAGTPTPSTPKAISGWSEISLTKCGKNLLNLNDIELLENDRYGVGISKTGTFYISGSYNGEAFIYARTKSGDTYGEIKYIQIGEQNTATPISIMVGNGETLLLYNASANQTLDISKEKLGGIQLEVGSSVSTYEPYNGTTEVINLGGTYYGGHFTQDKAGHRQFVATHSILVLSSDNMNIIGRVNANKYRVFNSNCGAKITGINYADNILCDKLRTQTGTTNDDRCYINASGDIRMNFTAEYDTVADMIAAFNSITLVYPLETPIIIDLPDGEPIITLNGTNNIYADTGDTEVVFKSSVNDYVSAHSGGNLLGMGGVYLGGAKSGGSEEETDEGEDTEKIKLDETKVEVKEIGDDSNIKKLGGE